MCYRAKKHCSLLKLGMRLQINNRFMEKLNYKSSKLKLGTAKIIIRPGMMSTGGHCRAAATGQLVQTHSGSLKALGLKRLSTKATFSPNAIRVAGTSSFYVMWMSRGRVDPLDHQTHRSGSSMLWVVQQHGSAKNFMQVQILKLWGEAFVLCCQSGTKVESKSNMEEILIIPLLKMTKQRSSHSWRGVRRGILTVYGTTLMVLVTHLILFAQGFGWY